MAFSLFKILEPFGCSTFTFSSPKPAPIPYPRVTSESQDPYPAPATVPGSLQPQASCCSNFGAGCCQGQALGWLRLAPGGGVRLRSSSGRLQAGWGMRGWAGKKKSKKSQLEKSKKSQKQVKCADPSLGGLLEATKSQKKSRKKVKSGKSQKKVKKKSKKSQKKVENKSKKSQKKVKCENQARILALADYWRRQKVKKKSKKSQFCSRLWGRTGLGTWDSGVATRATRDRAGLGLKRPWDSGWGWAGVLRLWGTGLGLAWGWKR